MKIQELAAARHMQDLAFDIRELHPQIFMLNNSYRNPYHMMVWVTGGKGTMNIDGTLYTIAPGQLLLMAAGQMYQVLNNHHLQGYVLSFSDAFWERTPASARNCKATLFNNARLQQLLVLDEDAGASLTKLMQHLLEEYQADNYSNKPDVLAAFLKIIIIKAANLRSLLTLSTHNHDYRLYQRFLELVNQEYHRQHNVAAYAKKLGLSTRKLTEVCKQYGGEGAKELINHRLIVEAQRLLQFSEQPIKEISFSLNFATPYQFSNFFKKNTSQSPAAYKKQFAEIGI